MTNLLSKLFLFGVSIAGFTFFISDMIYYASPLIVLLYTTSILCAVYSGHGILKRLS